MFCKKCGHPYADGIMFCTQCGARLISDEPASEVPEVKTPITKKEFFESHCSESVQKKRKTIKRLSIGILTAQGLWFTYCVIVIIALSVALSKSPIPGIRDAAGELLSILRFFTFFTTGSFIFTILGLKKNSTGFFVAATIFAFFSVVFCAGTTIESLPLRWLAFLVALAIYITITVLNHQNIKEYKKYMKEASSDALSQAQK